MKYNTNLLIFQIGAILALSLYGCKTSQSNPLSSDRERSSDVESIKANGEANVPAPLTEDKVKNADYQFEDFGRITLTDGVYEAPPETPGGEPKTAEINAPIAFGDFNSDNLKDAIAIIRINTGGSGGFVMLTVLFNENGNPKHTLTTFIGDRPQPKSVTVKGNQILIEMITHDSDDAMCCPTLEVTRTYQLQGNKIVLITEKPKPKTPDLPAQTN